MLDCFLRASLVDQVMGPSRTSPRKAVILVCGKQIARMEFLLAIICFIYWSIRLSWVKVPRDIFQMSPLYSRVFARVGNRIYEYLREEDKSKAAPLHRLLRRVWNLQSSARKGKVYSLLGIASDTFKTHIEIDPHKPLEAVGRRCRSFSLLHDGLQILDFPFRNTTQCLDGLPGSHLNRNCQVSVQRNFLSTLTGQPSLSRIGRI